jgi:FtsX-like permease family
MTASSGRYRRGSWTGRGVLGSTWALAGDSRSRTVLVIVALALALVVAGLIFLAEITSQGELRSSIFGQVVLLRLAPYHLLAAAAAFFAAGALALDVALITVERRLPVIGILRATGWRRREVARMIAIEVISPALLAAVIAAVLLTAIGIAIGSGLFVLLAIDAGLFAVAVLVGLLAAAIPIQLALTALPWTAMRAEGASSTVPGLASRQALVTVTALLVAVVLVSASWSAAEVAGEAPPPFAQPAAPGLGPTAARIQADVAALTALPDRIPASTNSEAALAYVSQQLTAAGYSTVLVGYPAQPEFADANGQALQLTSLTVEALAFDPDPWDGTPFSAPVTLVDVQPGIEATNCSTGITVLRLSGWAQVPLVPELEQKCRGITSVVVGVVGDDATWSDFANRASTVHFAAAHFLLGEPQSAAGAAPWLVATLDASGPGATESAGPLAVAVDVARRAAEAGVPLRMAIGTGSDGAAISLLIERIAKESAGPMIWLGPMGGPASVVIGTQNVDVIDDAATQAGLLGVTAVDGTFGSWLAMTNQLSANPTSAQLLDLISTATSLPVTDEGSGNLFALPLGLDAAWLGEPVLVPDMRSVAGTSLDTVDVVNPRRLDAIAASLLDVVGSPAL